MAPTEPTGILTPLHVVYADANGILASVPGPATNCVLVNGTSTPCGTASPPSSGAAARYPVSFSNVTTVTVPGTTHNLGTGALQVQCYDNASPANWILPKGITVDQTSFNVVISFASAQSGLCVIE